jgi:hypothetical protein
MSVAQLTTPNASVLTDKVEEVCRAWLPAYMMYGIGLKAKEQGLILREDFFLHLQQHMRKVVEGLDDISMARASKLTEQRALDLCREISTDNAITVLFVIMYSVMKAVDEGIITDVTSQPVLYTVLLIDESEDMGFETTFNRKWVKQKASEMFSTCYYKKWY